VKPPIRLRGRVVVVTGAGSGIGRGLAQAFADQGARLLLADVDAAGVEETRRTLATADASETCPTDVTDPAAVERLAARAFAMGDGVAVLCQNAGVAAGGLIWEQSLEDWHWMLGANVLGLVHGLRSFVPRLIAQGSRAHVVHTASMMGLLTAPGLGAYGATKHAALAISETLRHDLARAGAPIGVSVLCPGPVQTRVHEERTRPAASRRAAAADSATETQKRQIMALMAASLTPRAVADCVVRAVLEDRFFVFSHPEERTGVEARYAEIRAAV
jgi:NADP-dependent 3-hydroxy acid dehydrogenase YdfG